MMAVARRGLEFVIDLVGEILAFITIFLIALMYINGRFGFLPDGLRETLTVAREIMIIAVVSLKGFEFTLKRGVILTVIFGAVVLLVISFMFVPGSLPSWITDINLPSIG